MLLPNTYMTSLHQKPEAFPDPLGAPAALGAVAWSSSGSGSMVHDKAVLHD